MKQHPVEADVPSLHGHQKIYIRDRHAHAHLDAIIIHTYIRKDALSKSKQEGKGDGRQEIDRRESNFTNPPTGLLRH
jgi:hypothetical protein